MTTLIGTNPNQIPVNSMLGGMAYQDPDNVSVGKITYSGTLLGNGDVVFGGSSTIWTSTGRTSLNVNGTSSSIISLSTGGSVNTSGYLYWDNLNFDIQNNTVGGWVRIGTKDYPNALIISSSGNLGLGVTPSTWTAGYKAFEFGYNSLSSGDNANIHLTLNGYYNAGWKYKNNGNSNLYSQINGGGHVWYTAPSGTAGAAVTFTQAMSLDSSNLTLSGTGATKLQEGTTAQRPASPQEGMIRKNSTLGVIEGYSGGGYVSLENTLIGVTTLTALVGQDLTFTPNLKTSYMVVEMIGGGGGGGNMITATLTTGNVSIGESGTPGCAVRFLIKKENLQSTYYYRLGTAGASGFSSGQSGSPGGSTIFSQEPTSGTLSNAFTAAGGLGGAGGTEVTPPVTYLNLGTPALSIVGTASNWVILEDGQAYQGERITCVNVNLTSMRSSPEFNQNWWVRHPMTCFGVRGAGGRGGEKRQMTGGASSKSAEAGYTGMIRIYEYS